MTTLQYKIIHMRFRFGLEELEDRRLLTIVPEGFIATSIVSDLVNPVTMDIDNTGRIFLGLQDGTIRVIENDQLLPAPFAVLDSDGAVHPYPRPLNIRSAASGPGTPTPVSAVGGKVGHIALKVGWVLETAYEPGETW